MTDDNHGEIMQQLGKLEGLVTGINQRLDVSNGRLGKLEIRVDSLETTRDQNDGSKMNWREIGAALVAIVTTAVAIVALWIK